MTVTLIATPILCRICLWRRNKTVLRIDSSISTSNYDPSIMASARSLPPAEPGSRTSAVDLTFACSIAASPHSECQIQNRTQILLASVPLVLTFVKALAATWYGFQSQDTGPPVVACFEAEWNSVDRNKARSLNILEGSATAECALLLHSLRQGRIPATRACIERIVFTSSCDRF